MSRILCDCRIPIKSVKKNYKIDILLVMFYCRISNKKILNRIIALNYNQICNYIGIYFPIYKV